MIRAQIVSPFICPANALKNASLHCLPAQINQQILRRNLFSQDTDLFRLATAKQRTGKAFVGVIYAHQGSMSVGDCINELQLLVAACTPEELASRVQYLPLR